MKCVINVRVRKSGLKADRVSFFVKMVVKKLWKKLVNCGKSSNFAPDFVAGNDDFPLVLFSDKIVETSMWHDDAKVPHKA